MGPGATGSKLSTTKVVGESGTRFFLERIRDCSSDKLGEVEQRARIGFLNVWRKAKKWMRELEKHVVMARAAPHFVLNTTAPAQYADHRSRSQ